MSRSNGAERAQRLNAAFDLLSRGCAVAQAAAMLTEEFALSPRQAYRYLQEAQAIDRPEAARARAGHGHDDRRCGLASRLGVADSGTSAWLSATRAAESASSIALPVCSAPSSSRPTTFWFPITPAAPAGTLE